MAGQQRTPEQRMRDREAISDLICQGWTLHKIAEYLEISVSTVSREAADIRNEWVEATFDHRMLFVQKELRRLDMLDRENWAAWEHSKKPEVTTIEETGEGPSRSKSRVEQQMEEAIGGTAVSTRSQVKKRTQSGNPVFLQNVFKSIEQRCKLLGLYPEDLPPQLKEAEAKLHQEELEPDDPAIALFERITGSRLAAEAAIESAIG